MRSLSPKYRLLKNFTGLVVWVRLHKKFLRRRRSVQNAAELKPLWEEA